MMAKSQNVVLCTEMGYYGSVLSYNSTTTKTSAVPVHLFGSKQQKGLFNYDDFHYTKTKQNYDQLWCYDRTLTKRVAKAMVTSGPGKI